MHGLVDDEISRAIVRDSSPIVLRGLARVLATFAIQQAKAGRAEAAAYNARRAARYGAAAIAKGVR